MIRRSFAMAFLDKSAGVVITLITMAIVSRILTPSEIGLFMVASTVVILIEAFRDFGVGAFIVQQNTLSPQMLRTAATIIALMSVALGLTITAAAGLLARYYNDPDLAALIRIAAISFVVAPISNPLLALLRRAMAFDRVAAISITAALSNAVTTVTLALAGHGAYSLIWGSVVGAMVTTVGAVLCQPTLWIFRPSLQHWRQVVPFGAWSTVVTLLGMLFDAFPRLILGRVLGFGAVGLFARSLSITQLPDRLLLSAVQPVLLPAMAGHARTGDVRAPFLTGLSYVSGLQWPALAMIALLADPIVRLLLGSQWIEIVPLVRIVALMSFCLFPAYICFPVLVALGHVRDMALAMVIALPPCFAIMLLASRYGLQVMAYSLLLTGLIQAGTILRFVQRRVGFTRHDLTGVIRKSGTLCVVTVAMPLALVAATDSWVRMGPVVLGLSIGLAAAGWIAGLWLVDHPIRSEVSVLLRGLRRPALDPARQ